MPVLFFCAVWCIMYTTYSIRGICLSSFYAYYRDSVTSRGGIIHMHTQEYFELYQMLYSSGKFYYFIDDVLYEPNPNDVLIVRPGIIHGGVKTVGARYRRVHVKIPKEIMDTVAIVEPNVDDFIRNSDISMVSLSGKYADEYSELTEKIKALTANCSSNTGSLELLSIVLRQLRILFDSSKSKVNPAVNSHNELIHRIVELVNRDYTSLSSAEDIAAALNYSVNYLSQYFKKHMNISLHEFLMQKKLSASTAMLISDKNINECAFACGFSSPSYFSYAFKKRFGKSPSVYAKLQKS